MLTRIGTVILKVSDMERSTAFYRDLLGLTVKYASPGWTEFALDGAALALHPAPPECVADVGANGVTLNFAVDDLKKVVAELKSRGAPSDLTVISEDFGKFAEILDPDGYAIGIVQLKKT
ncbi:MAG: VOC family protein [Planctomycetes bacterium]|nr:VOC family protein [Planctomycetota bacterium]